MSKRDEFRAAARHNPERIAIGDLARQTGVTLRALRFYQSKGLLAPQFDGYSRTFDAADRERLNLIQQGKRLGFTLTEIREMLAARDSGASDALPIDRRKCIEQIALLEKRRSEVETALAELRRIYTSMFIALERAPPREEASSPAQQ